jgi:hypothetical protein
VSEGALFSGQASIDLQDAPGEAAKLAYQEDELRMGYEQSVRRTAEWYRSTLFEPKPDADHESVKKSDAAGISVPDESMADLGPEAALSRLGAGRHNGSEGA